MMNDVLPTYTLNREESGDDGTLGELLDPDGDHLCYTCECPWLDNASGISCIPSGTYACVPHNSPAHPDTWQLQDVPGRDEILIHNGNTKMDSKGCILVGEPQGILDGLPAVLNSKATLAMLQQTLPGNFTLIITDPVPAVPVE
jgi:hypothetical protein